MQRTVDVFVIPKSRTPGGPPEASRTLVVEGRSTDDLRDAAQSKLVKEGFRVRSLSFGPKGMVAYVENDS